jgi:signal transduction histidine kinase
MRSSALFAIRRPLELLKHSVFKAFPRTLPFERFWQLGFISLVYIVVARLTLGLMFPEAEFSAVWLPAGLGMGLMINTGYWIWPAIVVSVFSFSFGIGEDGVHSIGLSLGAVLGDSSEALIATYLVRKAIQRRNPLLRANDLFKFIVLGAMVGPVVGSTIGNFTSCITGATPWNSFLAHWLLWWLENMLGAIVVAPFIISWGQNWPSVQEGNWRRALEFCLVLCLLAVTAGMIFAGWFPTPVKDYPLEYLCIPLLVWAAFRFEERGATAAILVLSILSILGTLKGYGPFYRSSVPESLHLLQMYIGTNALFVLLVVSVIAERKRAEQRLARSNLELERFAYLASHDLQEPLRTVSGFCRLIEKRYKGRLDAQADEYIDFAVSGANRMHTLITSVLEYSRLGRHLTMGASNTHEVFREALANIDGVVRETKAEIEFSRLPVVAGDSSLLILVFQNLLANATRATKDCRPQIRVFAELKGYKWVFTVEDNGVGIEPEYFEKIFRLFHRGTPGGFPYLGSGVGLATCKKIIEEHGGKIWVESEVGLGSKFRFTLADWERWKGRMD